MRIKLPFIQKKNVELNKLSDELIVRVGGFKRHVLLPRQVAAARKVNARLEGEHLLIHFKGDNTFPRDFFNHRIMLKHT